VTTSAASSYSCGPCELPLLGQTIGANFDAGRPPSRILPLVEHATDRHWAHHELAGEVHAVAPGRREPRNEDELA
jgi:hypothetical protein